MVSSRGLLRGGLGGGEEEEREKKESDREREREEREGGFVNLCARVAERVLDTQQKPRLLIKKPRTTGPAA